jgi:hypothetical protein
VSSELIDEDDVQVIDGNQELTTDMTIEVELAHLFLNVSIGGKNTTQAKQKEYRSRELLCFLFTWRDKFTLTPAKL